jgi:hypothetical protein
MLSVEAAAGDLVGDDVGVARQIAVLLDRPQPRIHRNREVVASLRNGR